MFLYTMSGRKGRYGKKGHEKKKIALNIFLLL